MQVASGLSGRSVRQHTERHPFASFNSQIQATFLIMPTGGTRGLQGMELGEQITEFSAAYERKEQQS